VSGLREHLRLRELPLTSLVLTLGGWLLIYLLMNTDNPYSQLINVDANSFLVEARWLDYVVYVFGHVLLVLAALGFLVLGMGGRGALLLLARPRSRAQHAPIGRLRSRLGLTALFVFALVVAFVLGRVMLTFLPERFFLDVPYNLEDFQYDSLPICLAVMCVVLCRMTLWQLFMLVPLALLMDTGVIDLRRGRHVVGLALMLFVLGGLAMASPAEGTVIFGVASYGFPSLVCGAYYLKTRSFPACVLGVWVVYELLSAIVVFLL
jgi:hypothetical protein